MATERASSASAYQLGQQQRARRPTRRPAWRSWPPWHGPACRRLRAKPQLRRPQFTGCPFAQPVPSPVLRGTLHRQLRGAEHALHRRGAGPKGWWRLHPDTIAVDGARRRAKFQLHVRRGGQRWQPWQWWLLGWRGSCDEYAIRLRLVPADTTLAGPRALPSAIPVPVAAGTPASSAAAAARAADLGPLRRCRPAADLGPLRRRLPGPARRGWPGGTVEVHAPLAEHRCESCAEPVPGSTAGQGASVDVLGA
mmetsp:Transcript_155214/g.497783  ORF Transcript_155214/g.497783 Transcript_155214/m.497783 type:complete len:252 (+) Transcript_155214:600-1355(+)